MPGPARSLRVDIATRDKQAIVRLLDGDTELAVAPFDFTLTGPHNEQVLQKIAGGKCDLDELKDVGSQLWGMLFAGDVARAFDTIIASAGDVSQTIVRLGLTPRLQALPWETLHDEKDVNVGFLSISKQMTLVRDTPFVPMAGALARAPGEPLSMLVLIPDGSNLNVEEEWAVLGKIREMGPGVTIKRLDGLVTATAIREELRKQTYDIVHYIGHGLDENGEFSIRLNEEGSARNEQWLGAEAFSLLFTEVQQRPPSLVVLNCCYGGGGDSRKSLSGVGPYLMRIHVPAVIAMQYEIPDDVATDFAGAFYKELFGAASGRVDLALGWARRTLFPNRRSSTARGFITPVLYLAENHEQLFTFADAAAEPVAGRADVRPVAPVRPVRDRATVERMDRIIAGVRDGRAVPIVGPGILKVGATRSGPIAPGPGELVRLLGDESKYPYNEELALAHVDRFGEGVLPWVCQHYLTLHTPYELVTAVQKLFSAVTYSQAMRDVASWPSHAVIATYFDGLIDEGFDHVHKTPRPINVNGVDFGFEKDETILLRVRGTQKQGASLVLTQQEHDQVYDRLGKLDGAITMLFRGHLGRFPLFLGVSPRDTLTMRLMTQFIGPNDTNQEPGYFIAPAHTRSDETWWSRCKVDWFDCDLRELLEEINAAVLPGGGR